MSIQHLVRQVLRVPTGWLGAALLTAGAGACADADAPAKIQRLEAENAALRRSAGGQNAYECLVRDVRQLSDAGMLADAAPTFRNQVVGATFVVDRETGVISGGIGGNGTFASRTVVFTPPENPFYVVSTTQGPNRNVEYLSVREWVVSPDKPFVLADASNVYTGTCRS